MNINERDITVSTLDTTDVATIEPRLESKLFLGPSLLESQFAQPLSKELSRVLVRHVRDIAELWTMSLRTMSNKMHIESSHGEFIIQHDSPSATSVADSTIGDHCATGHVPVRRIA